MESPLSADNRRRAVELMKASCLRKPAILRDVQRDSMQHLYENLLAGGTSPQDILFERDAGMICVRRSSEFELVFAQLISDDLVRQKFAAFRDWLPREARIHGLSLDHVGALAANSHAAYVGIAETETDDFIAYSEGIDRIHLWGLLVARCLSATVVPKGNDPELEAMPLEDWKSCLAPLAGDLLGWPTNHEVVAALGRWGHSIDVRNEELLDLILPLQAFIVLHEMGHYELKHGDVSRRGGIRKPLTPELTHRMEYEADCFAVAHLLRMLVVPAKVGFNLAVMFALFALDPACIEQYPTCPDFDTHPHPLTRLVWILRDLYPENPGELEEMLNVAIQIIASALERFLDIPFDGYDVLFHTFAMQKPDAPKPF